MMNGIVLPIIFIWTLEYFQKQNKTIFNDGIFKNKYSKYMYFKLSIRFIFLKFNISKSLISRTAFWSSRYNKSLLYYNIENKRQPIETVL